MDVLSVDGYLRYANARNSSSRLAGRLGVQLATQIVQSPAVPSRNIIIASIWHTRPFQIRSMWTDGRTDWLADDYDADVRDQSYVCSAVQFSSSVQGLLDRRRKPTGRHANCRCSGLLPIHPPSLAAFVRRRKKGNWPWLAGGCIWNGIIVDSKGLHYTLVHCIEFSFVMQLGLHCRFKTKVAHSAIAYPTCPLLLQRIGMESVRTSPADDDISSKLLIPTLLLFISRF